MPFKTETSINIQAPIGEVFQTITNLENSVHWSSQLWECKLLDDTSMKEGSRFYQKIKVFGRIVEYEHEILECVENKSFVTISKDEVMPVKVTYQFEMQTEGTLITMVSEGETGSVFQTIAAPLLQMLTLNSMNIYLKELKGHLERTQSV